MTSLQRDFLIPDLEEVMRMSGVEGTVAVQARQTMHETEWLLELAACHPFLLGVVGWVPLADPNVAHNLDRFVRNTKLKAVRHVLHDEPDDFYMLRDDFSHGVSLLADVNLAYDILIFERHLSQSIEFVDRHPRQIFVVDHMAKPMIKAGALWQWGEKVTELAKRENVYCKVSGMATEADWSHWTSEQLRPYFDTVLSAFGPKRIMFGSDWPVLTLASSYSEWVDCFQSFIKELSQDEQEEICCGTACRAYRLGDVSQRGNR